MNAIVYQLIKMYILIIMNSNFVKKGRVTVAQSMQRS